jgi:hypothetical protein
MTEFLYGDLVRRRNSTNEGGVVNEEHANTIHGNFDACLPLPVAVLWHDTNEVWWTPGKELELAR